MPKWTKKAALERMRTNEQLQQAYDRYPLARILVESAARLKRYPNYHRSSCYYAYKDWMWAATTTENEAFWICIKAIDDLLPPDACDLQLEGVPSISTYNPTLPGLPPRPERVSPSSVVQDTNGKYIFRTLSELDLDEIGGKERQRHLEMRKTLEQIAVKQAE